MIRRVALSLLAVCLTWGLVGSGKAQDCSSIAAKVCTLKTFEPDPTATGSNASGSPVCDDQNGPTDDQINDIEAAYELAPAKVHADLCKITQFFVFQSGSDRSWGRWENPLYHNTIPGLTQIAVNSDDLGKTFAQIQNDRLTGLSIDQSYGTHSETDSAGMDANGAVGLLYIFSHELAHIRWHKEAFIGEDPACSDDPNFYSWSPISNSDQTKRWTKFGEDFGSHKNTNIKKPGAVQSSDDLKAIYTNGFVTALGAANPEEDFVESYAIRTIIKACPQCTFEIQIPATNGVNIDLHNDRRNAALKQKFECVFNKHINPNKY